MRFMSIGCTMQMPVLDKLSNVYCSLQMDSYTRAQKLLPVMAELEEDFDAIVNGIGLNGVLMVARQANPDVPSADRFRCLYRSFKERLHDDPCFMQCVMTKLPTIVSKYDGNNIVSVLSDPEFMELITK